MLFRGRIDATQVTETTSVFYFSIYWQTHEFGRREQTAFSVGLIAEKDKWDNLKSKISKQAREQIESMNVQAPRDDLKMAGDPACQPRFGFLAPPKTQGDKTIYVVSEIVPGSPAQKAGFRLGDIVAAIDSEEYGNGALADPVYEEKSPLPGKLIRNGKTVRTSMTAAIICP